jgi:hypothetical protein
VGIDFGFRGYGDQALDIDRWNFCPFLLCAPEAAVCIFSSTAIKLLRRLSPAFRLNLQVNCEMQDLQLTSKVVFTICHNNIDLICGFSENTRRDFVEGAPREFLVFLPARLTRSGSPNLRVRSDM